MDLNLMVGEMKEKAEVKKLLSLLAHDLKSPIHNVIGFSSLLKELLANEPNPDVKFYIDIISREAESTLKLINKFSECCNEMHSEFSPDEKEKLTEILVNSKREQQKSVFDV